MFLTDILFLYNYIFEVFQVFDRHPVTLYIIIEVFQVFDRHPVTSYTYLLAIDLLGFVLLLLPFGRPRPRPVECPAAGVVGFDLTKYIYKYIFGFGNEF